jgi:hypothetical protein
VNDLFRSAPVEGPGSKRLFRLRLIYARSMMIFRRPLLVWVIALVFGVPALFFVVSHVLVLTGLISPPPHMRAHFENLDMATLLINGAEAVVLIACVGTLLAMKWISLPLFAINLLIDTIHNLSGQYPLRKSSSSGLIFDLVVDAALVFYVWTLLRKNLLR